VSVLVFAGRFRDLADLGFADETIAKLFNVDFASAGQAFRIRSLQTILPTSGALKDPGIFAQVSPFRTQCPRRL
jgi:hypothetical protein